MRKKIMAIVLATAMIMLTGCGNDTKESPTPTVASTATPKPTEAPAAETVVTLGQYKGLTLYEVDSEVIAEEIVAMLNNYAEPVVVERAAGEGDTVNINYVGKLDGVAFAGGTDDSEEGYNLTLGSGQFIDGFEEGLLGAVAGEVRDLNLTFPENYGSEELAGQSVVFTVTVNYVMENVVPELDDQFVAENLGFPTAVEYIEKLYEVRNEESYYQQLTAILMESSEVENYPAEDIAEKKQFFVDYYMDYAELYSAYFGMDTETILASFFGFESTAALEEYAEESAYSVVKEILVLEEIYKQEQLELTEEEYQQRITEYAYNNGYDVAEDFVADYEEFYGEGAARSDVKLNFIRDYVISQAEIIEAE